MTRRSLFYSPRREKKKPAIVDFGEIFAKKKNKQENKITITKNTKSLFAIIWTLRRT